MPTHGNVILLGGVRGGQGAGKNAPSYQHPAPPDGRYRSLSRN